MHSKDDEYTFMHNGEIYNYVELKEKFFKNISFNTKSDTEVFFKLWQKKANHV